MLHELHTSAFAPVLRACGWPVGCEDCDGDLGCGEAFGLTNKGAFTREPDHNPDTVVSWPTCPGKYYELRRVGADVMTLAAAVEWGVDREYHKHPDLGAGGARLYREWLRIKELPASLRLAREREDRKRKGGAA